MLVNHQLNEVLAEMGITPIQAIGEHFDPHFHEAASVEETDEFPPNTVTAEFLRGYRIGDKVVRASMVKVSK
jgi:molecular chaperone GrpE